MFCGFSGCEDQSLVILLAASSLLMERLIRSRTIVTHHQSTSPSQTFAEVSQSHHVSVLMLNIRNGESCVCHSRQGLIICLTLSACHYVKRAHVSLTPLVHRWYFKCERSCKDSYFVLTCPTCSSRPSRRC